MAAARGQTAAPFVVEWWRTTAPCHLGRWAPAGRGWCCSSESNGAASVAAAGRTKTSGIVAAAEVAGGENRKSYSD